MVGESERLRFERHGLGASFVELARAGPCLSRTWGWLGTEGTLRAEWCADEDTAGRALERQMHRLEAKGYWPGRHNLELVRRIQAAPDNPAPYLVYADWLLERQDARGDLIVSMSDGRTADASALLDAHPVQLRPTWWARCASHQVWRLGFLERLTLSRCWEASLVRRILRHPSAFALQELTVHATGHARDGGSLPSWRLALLERPESLKGIVLVGAPALAPLRAEFPRLELG